MLAIPAVAWTTWTDSKSSHELTVVLSSGLSCSMGGLVVDEQDAAFAAKGDGRRASGAQRHRSRGRHLLVTGIGCPKLAAIKVSSLHLIPVIRGSRAEVPGPSSTAQRQR